LRSLDNDSRKKANQRLMDYVKGRFSFGSANDGEDFVALDTWRSSEEPYDRSRLNTRQGHESLKVGLVAHLADRHLGAKKATDYLSKFFMPLKQAMGPQY